MNDYPLFLPPEHLSTRQPREWSSAEADEYRTWLISSLDERVAHLLEFLDVREDPNTEEFLLLVGRKAVAALNEDLFSEDGPRGKRLSNLGYALAADMGLLVAKLLLKSCGDHIYWNTVRKPKSELSYNLAVLEGFKNNYLDPVGGATAEASAVLRGQRDENTWVNIYTFWCNQAG